MPVSKILSIMLSNTADDTIREMTDRALITMNEGKGDNIELRCIVVETNINNKPYEQHWVHTFYPNIPFNYNKFINVGYGFSAAFWCEFFSQGCDQDKYIAIANNDLIYHTSWASELIQGINQHNLDSASPINPGWPFHREFEEEPSRNVFEGWRIGWEFCGWKFLMKYTSFKKVYPLDEAFLFWCQDNDLVLTMQRLDMRHALIKSSRVTHLTSQSHHLIPVDKHYEFTHGQAATILRKLKSGKYDK